MPKMNTLDWLGWILVIVGALNWGFIGIANLNLVTALFGVTSSITQFVYILVGLGGLYSVWKILATK